MALNREQWLADIQEVLFKDNAIIGRAVNHDGFIGNKTVHIPQSGANPSITKNISSLPATITQRTDTEVTYDVDAYYIPPILIESGQETAYLSYDKRMSIMGQHIMTLEEVITNHALYKWAPSGAATQVRTTGAADGLALAPSATGTRKAITLADIAAAKKILDSQNVPQSGRILLMNSDIYNAHFLAISNIQSALVYGSATLPTGVVGRIMGFDIMIRSTVVVFDNTGTPVIKTIDDNGAPSSAAATDNLACLAYHPSFVAKAMGSTEVLVNEAVAEYYGSIVSAYQNFGASKMRSDQKGIVSIIQTWVS